ncbi:type II toxin-antitoxin system VapC family toxin [Leptospira interrogans serovar Icterohaemorrhagiae]|uniref:type II toxin-antitoxin system VapC family toxin n=1 Tax=Leptospira TaxID=171 RepID=UPI0002BAD91B|nr:type II toxin-antitoxin system VapC family toxin [Leptospira interrogans]QOI33239.1 type II toxin-antitoxin system VapC family toxin [Leptospira interrogans serovar Icterohaemorrhagiae]QOI33255.1 type II toxin-antitoxin system VapC family toxin [Leptospira interrogans serovar Icterohaemorrhagiae]QOI35561.1 type II toxin-antitoxin system VapC family toxin [Leptospira interrogans serovar Icterohaemorrhagiae]
MELKFLLDTNTIIDHLANQLPESGANFVDNLLPAISVISKIELLGWNKASEEEISRIKNFISLSQVLPLDEQVIKETISLRQSFKIKTPDAIIAATAIVHGLSLISRNTQDFKSIFKLIILDPWKI